MFPAPLLPPHSLNIPRAIVVGVVAAAVAGVAVAVRLTHRQQRAGHRWAT